MKKVAIVNDEQDFVDMVKLLLEDEGYAVRWCTDGAAALDLLREWRPDLLLLDIRMSGLTGWQVMEQMSRDNSLKDVRVLVTSGAVEEIGPEVGRLRDLGHDYIPLPFDIDVFIDKIRHMTS